MELSLPPVIVVETRGRKQRRDCGKVDRRKSKGRQSERWSEDRTPSDSTSPLPTRRYSNPPSPSIEPSSIDLEYDQGGPPPPLALSDISTPEYPVRSDHDRDSGYGSSPPTPSQAWASLASSSRGSSSSRSSKRSADRISSSQNEKSRKYPPNASKTAPYGGKKRSTSWKRK